MARKPKMEAGYGGCRAPEEPRPVSAPGAAPPETPEEKYLEILRKERALRKQERETGVKLTHAFPHLRQQKKILREEIEEAGGTVPKLPRSGNRTN